MTLNAFARKLLPLLVCSALALPAHAQLETRGERDAAGLRSELAERGEPAPTLAELSEAYDRASASWLEVFGPAPFAPASAGARSAIRLMAAKGWAPKASVVVAMLDARGDAAWEENGSCRAQLNIGSNGTSPVALALGAGAFDFLSAHELAHCLFDQTAAAERIPTTSDMLSPGFPLHLTPAQADSVSTMLRAPSSIDGSDLLTSGYDEALADALAASALQGLPIHRREAISKALSLRLGALSMAMHDQVGPPVHMGAYALSKALSGNAAPTLGQARQDALASAMVHSLAATPARWSARLEQADPANYAGLVAQAKALSTPLFSGRDLGADESAYLSARSPSLFVMDLSGTRRHSKHAPSPHRTPAQSLALWHAAAWIPSR